MSGKIEITLIRHGETLWSLSGRHTGLTDLELTSNGVAQATQLKTRLMGQNFDHVFCSPLKRAIQTATFAGLFPGAKFVDDLKEWDYGDFEGLTTEQIRQTTPSWNVFVHGAPNGESPAQVAKRADRVIEGLNLLQGKVAVVSSAHFLRSFAARWLKEPISLGQHLFLSTASISILGHERETPVIKLWNTVQTT